jgi:hypothetical protein
MRTINVFGLFPFAFVFNKYRSYMSLCILVNGVMYHTFEDNIYLFYNDLFWNLLIIIHGFRIFNNFLRKHLFFSGFLYLVNNHLLQNHKILTDIFHTVFVQWYMCLLMYLHITGKKNLELTTIEKH